MRGRETPGFKTRILEPSFGTRLQEVVAGAGFEPATFGYENYLTLSRLFQSTTYSSVVSPFLLLVARFCGANVVKKTPQS